MIILRTLSRRDTILVLLGALSMHLFSSLFSSPFDRSSFVVNTHLSQYHPPNLEPLPPPPEPPVTTHLEHQTTTTTAAAIARPAKPATTTTSTTSEQASPDARPVPIDQARTLPETTIVSHAPGWTIFRNLYMADGTFYIVSKHSLSAFPEIRQMISVPIYAEATPENIAAREPTKEDMDFLSPEQAKRIWGGDIDRGQKNRIWSVQGSTFFCNDPDQFLHHYYHFVAELLFGAWAFWSGTFSSLPSSTPALFQQQIPPIPFSSTPNISIQEPIDRIVFAHSTSDGWRDNPGFNAYILRAAFPSVTVEVESDWLDRVEATPKIKHVTNVKPTGRAWHFPLVLLADRSAAFRGEACGSRTQRTAAEAVEAMMAKGTLQRSWWEPVRRAIVQFAGGDPEGGRHAIEPRSRVRSGGGGEKGKRGEQGEKDEDEDEDKPVPRLPMPARVVVTYIVRQSTRRRLISEDHEVLVEALEEAAERRGWELNVVTAENLSKDDQVRIMSKTTILLGVHGNGLTHLVLMPQTRVSAVIEIFFPGGFAHDYQWTTHALGMRHFAVWNDTARTLPDKPKVDYPEGFQGSEIPAYGPAIVQLIEDRVDGKL